MLEKPDLQDERIVACLQANYDPAIVALTFLPLGVDVNTAVYRAETAGGTTYFVKLRRGDFDENTVTVPRFLSDSGIREIIPPLMTKEGRLWAGLEPFKLILYPFVAGRDGYEVVLTARQWQQMGVALKAVHTAALPPALAGGIRRETYDPRWRDSVRRFLEQVRENRYDDPIAARLAEFLHDKRRDILDLIAQADRCARLLQDGSPELVLCHTDLHAGNILVGDEGDLFIVDWDNPLIAARERDLMFIGGAQGFTGHSTQQEEKLFYQGYGPVDIDPTALAYYRFERIIEDIAAFCEQLLLSDTGGPDRPQALRYVMSNFAAGGTIEAAYRVKRYAVQRATATARS